jgi:predicted RNA methylase
MNQMVSPAASVAAVSPVDPANASLKAARTLLIHLQRGQRIDAVVLRAAMEDAYGASDASGVWTWKQAYDVCEAALVLFLRQYGPALMRKAGSAEALLPMLDRLSGLMPSHTRRSEESVDLQQFSTPLPLGLAAAHAAAIRPGDLVLEPSAGTGLMAALAEMRGGQLVLNELSDIRAGLLSGLFPAASVTSFDATQIHDHLNPDIAPSVVLMNPPFSVMAQIKGRVTDAAYRHVASALARLADGGRLVTITGAGFAPHNPTWSGAFAKLQETGTVVFSAPIAGAAYARHGTTTETRLTVIDKRPAEDPHTFPTDPGTAQDSATLMSWLGDLPARLPVSASSVPVPKGTPSSSSRPIASRRPGAGSAPRLCRDPEAIDLSYETTDWAPPEETRLGEAIYETYSLQSITIPGAKPHPTKLVQSAAMASVAPPKPSYRPHLPVDIHDQLSEAQLETVIYAGEAHGEHLAGHWTVDETFDALSAAPEGEADAVQFRRGFMLGDGTGPGKGRHSAGIVLDNWLQGRRKALWISKSDKLLEDAQRDWSALGMERLLVTPLSRFSQGRMITLNEGILFTTYATLRSEARGGKASRVEQIVEWLGKDFDGVIIFDESHAMQNAAGGKGERGDVAASQQGRAGLRLQHALPQARVVYVSATGATTVHNLAYAQRLGLWGGDDFPFATRSEFVEAIEAGGVAAMEVLARDLRALGLYTARSLSYDGVEYELIEHQLTPEQTRIYDAYAGAFAIIHNNLTAAMEAANITGDSGGTLNRQAKSAARSAFESAKQRFFGHLLTGMKAPTMIKSIRRDLENGHSAVIQIVSTGEALMERRLSGIPTEDWNDLQIDITPREYVLDYLAHSFPTQLYEPVSDDEGNLTSRPVMRDGQVVECREAADRRDALIERLASLPPVPGALDQIIQHFGTDVVAEVTGRSRRIIRKTAPGAPDRLMVGSRAGSANLTETQAFMDDQKQVLIFSDAGGTGRSYHADLGAKNQRLRVHYLLEPGWKADAAIQGLGRTNRTNQAQPPLFRPVSTDVKAEKRFLSTIARRLDTLGAITRGQRQTGGQGMFRPEDNLESPYARDALRQLYLLIVRGGVEGCSLAKFEASTGLKLMDDTGIKDDLPPITTFLNRLLALTIEMQGILYTEFEALLSARIEGAIASGLYDVGLETLRAESFTVTDRQVIHTHPGTGAQTRLLTLSRRERNHPMGLQEALAYLDDPKACLLINERSNRAAVQVPTTSVMDDDGVMEPRIRLIRPMEASAVPLKLMPDTLWVEADAHAFAAAWNDELANIPEFSDSTLHVVTGLLLPIWKRLPQDSTRVYRLQTDQGERIIGRRVTPAWAAAVSATADGPDMSAADIHAALQEGQTLFELQVGLQLRRSRVMNAQRIELCGFNDAQLERLKADGCFSEIISWKLRLFIPVDLRGVEVLDRLLSRHPVTRISDRKAA